jgi:hemolysin activation/secretion protein
VKRHIALGAQNPLNRDRLLEALQLLQLNPLIETLSAEISPGTRPGRSTLDVRVQEAKSFDINIALDNGRSPSVGSFRRRLQLNEANLLGQGDSLNLGYTNTEGSNGLDLKYTYPLNPRNGTLSFAYGITFSHVIEEPFNTLDINSQSSYYELTLRQPVMQTPKQELGLGLTLTRQASESSFSLFNNRFVFPSPGADEEGKTRIWALRVFQDWTRRDRQQVIAVRSQLSVGLDAFGSTINQSGPDSNFLAWRGQGQYVRSLAPDTLFLFRTDIQLADRPLVPLEQFSIGGIDSVRGYRQDLLLADNGIFASAELRIPILRLREINSLLQIAPFIEVGKAWNTDGRATGSDFDTLASAGFGMRWQTRDRLTARFDWGIPFMSVGGEKRSLQENGLYFSIFFRQPF